MLSNNFGLHFTDANGTVGFVIEIVEFFFEADIFEAFLALAAVHAPPGPHRDVLHGHPSPLKGDDLLEVGVVLAGVGLGGPLHHVDMVVLLAQLALVHKIGLHAAIAVQLVALGGIHGHPVLVLLVTRRAFNFEHVVKIFRRWIDLGYVFQDHFHLGFVYRHTEDLLLQLCTYLDYYLNINKKLQILIII